jgi:type II secretory pathway component PulF
MERAREDIIKFQKQANETREDVVKQLNRSVKHLRQDVEQLLEGDERATRLAKELETVAQDIEKRTEKRIGEVTEAASNNVMMTIVIAFGVGLVVGLMFKIFNGMGRR